MLRAKLQAVQLTVFESVPHHLLSRGQVLSKLSSRRNEVWSCSTNALRIHQAN